MPPRGKEYAHYFDANSLVGVIFFREVLSMADKKELIAKLQELYPEGKISCSEARGIAAKLDIPLGDMGERCDLAGLKICACELGCF